MNNRRLRVIGTTLVSGALLALATFALAQDKKETFNAMAVNMGTGPTGSTTIQLTIERWSTEEERAMLLTTLKEKGHGDFMKALRKQKQTGFLRSRGALAEVNPMPSTRLHYAWQYIDNGKRYITLITDRPITMAEQRANRRSLEYDTTAVKMEFPLMKEGDDNPPNGTGQLYTALKIRYDADKKTLEVEQWGSEPVRLTSITQTSK
jgi:hypothetical protein